MNIEHIPAELRARPQWVLWKSEIRNGAVTKPPYNPHQPYYNADVTDSRTWSTFDHALSVWQQNPSTVSGIGYVFTGDDGFFGLDIDDERKVKPEYIELRRGLVSDILNTFKTYTELSPSGQGLHLIGRGKLPFDGRRAQHAQIELYGARHFFTVTGNVFDGRNQITDQQAALDRMVAGFAATGGTDEQGDVLDTTAYRRTDLTDEEVIRMATNFAPTFAPRFNGQVGCEPGEWSETYIFILGTLDRFTGLVEQVKRIIMNSPMVTHSQPSRAGESRIRKAERNFQTVLRRVRGNNSGTAYFVQHGYEQMQNIERARAERAKEAAERMLNAERAILSGQVMDAFTMLSDEHKKLTPPPGVMAEFVEATDKFSHMPFTKFAIPATIAALAGVIGRGYKLPGGRGINVNFIVVGPSSIGKSQTWSAWEAFVQHACADTEQNSYNSTGPRYFMQNSASSIQGIFDEFMKSPSLCWAMDECGAQLQMMASGKTSSEAQFRDSYNQLYDSASHGRYFQPPKSMAGKKADYHGINNCSVSTYWLTTPSKFDVRDSDALDGFLSRVTIIRHEGKAGERRWDQEMRLDERLHSMLCALVSNARRLDLAYGEPSAPRPSHEAAGLITTVSTDQIQELRREILLLTDKIRDAALEKQLPAAYTAVSRLPVTAERIAATLAVVENPYTPSITQEQYLWAFGYVLQNALDLLADMDAGEIGQKASDETLTVVRVMREMYKNRKGHAPGVRRDDLRRRLMGNKPFKDAKEMNRSGSKWVSETIDHMLKEGMLQQTNGEGALSKHVYLAPTDDPIWSE